MTLFPIILAANFMTLVMTVIAAIKYPTWSYRLIGLVALCTFLFALHQFLTGQYQGLALLLSALSVFLITVRVLVNFWKSKWRKPGFKR
jgi:predicted ferric reductase